MKYLEFIDHELSHHFMSLDAKIGNFLWQGWTSLYTDMLPKSDWLILFDHLVAYPEYVEIFVVLLITELSVQRSALLGCSERQSLDAYLSNVKIENVKVTLRRTIQLLTACSKSSAFGFHHTRALPLHKDAYKAYQFLPRSLTQAQY